MCNRYCQKAVKQMPSQPQEAVVLVHGLWMRPWTMQALAHALEKAGYRVYFFGYPTVRRDLDSVTRQLAAFVNSRPEPVVHLLAHSMGGTLSLRALKDIRKPGRLVMLGSPIAGSQVAHRLQKLRLHRWLLGHATEPLTQGAADKPPSRETGMIAGVWPWGIGKLVNRFSGPNDGTVSLDETRADWLQHHITVNTNHLGLLKNREVQKEVLHFLRHGRFSDENPATPPADVTA